MLGYNFLSNFISVQSHVLLGFQKYIKIPGPSYLGLLGLHATLPFQWNSMNESKSAILKQNTLPSMGQVQCSSSLAPVQGWGLLITHTVNIRHIKYKTRFYIKEITIPHLPCRRAWQTTLVLLPGESHGLRSLGQATVHKVVKSRAWLKWLSVLARTPFCSFLGGSVVKNLPVMEEACVQLLGWEDPLEKEMVTHSSILAWEIPWTEQPGRLQSLGSQRVGQELVTEQQQYSMEIQRFGF